MSRHSLGILADSPRDVASTARPGPAMDLTAAGVGRLRRTAPSDLAGCQNKSRTQNAAPRTPGCIAQMLQMARYGSIWAPCQASHGRHSDSSTCSGSLLAMPVLSRPPTPNTARIPMFGRDAGHHVSRSVPTGAAPVELGWVEDWLRSPRPGHPFGPPLAGRAGRCAKGLRVDCTRRSPEDCE